MLVWISASRGRARISKRSPSDRKARQRNQLFFPTLGQDLKGDLFMKHSTDRILTTHCGSLARPKNLLDLMKAKVTGEPYDKTAYTSRVQSAVAEIVRKQVENGID